MKTTVFTGSGVALVTPMHSDLSVNYEKLGELIEFHIQNKTDAIVITGTTGEASTLTDQEHLEVIRYTVERVGGRIPVIRRHREQQHRPCSRTVEAGTGLWRGCAAAGDAVLQQMLTARTVSAF